MVERDKIGKTEKLTSRRSRTIATGQRDWAEAQAPHLFPAVLDSRVFCTGLGFKMTFRVSNFGSFIITLLSLLGFFIISL